jgi:transcription termination factor NusB
MDFYDDYRNPDVLHVAKKTGIKDTVDELSKLTDTQLVDELAKQVALKKQNGTLGDIEKLIKTIRPFLNAEQKGRLTNVIKNIQRERP